MFFATGTAVQICYAMFIAFVFLIAHINKKAYKERSDFQIQTVSMICIFLTLWLGLMMRTGVVVEVSCAGSEPTHLSQMHVKPTRLKPTWACT